MVARHRIPAERRLEMLGAVRSGFTHVDDVAVNCGVSEMTVRRDLRELRGDFLYLGTSGIDADPAAWDTTMVEVPQAGIEVTIA